jgi:signal transduction histidine kinase
MQAMFPNSRLRLALRPIQAYNDSRAPKPDMYRGRFLDRSGERRRRYDAYAPYRSTALREYPGVFAPLNAKRSIGMTEYEELRTKADTILEQMARNHTAEYAHTLECLQSFLQFENDQYFDSAHFGPAVREADARTPGDIGRVHLDQRCDIVFANSAAEALIGRDDSAIGAQFADLLADSSRAVFETIVHRINTGEEGSSVAELRLARSGCWMLTLLSCTPDGAMMLSMIDITSRKTAEAALRRSHEEMARRYVHQRDSLQQAHAALDREHGRRHAAEQTSDLRQRALERVYAIATAFDAPLESTVEQIAVSIADLLGASCVMVASTNRALPGMVLTRDAGISREADAVALSARQRLRFAAKSAPFCETGAFDSFIREDLRPARSLTSLAGVPIHAADGFMPGAILVLDSPRNFSREELRLIEIFARYLSQAVRHSVLEKELHRSAQMNVLGQLASGVAHEVRNPLNAIIAIMEALNVEIGGSSDYEPYLHHMRAQIERLTNLMEDLLALGRPLTPRDLTIVSVADLVQTCLAPLRKLFEVGERRIVLVMPEGASRWLVRADKNRIAQVFTNLIENAAQHSPGNAAIQITVLEPRSSMIGFRVTDHGVGISSEALKRLFEPFYTTRKGGTGLGLFIVKHIIESHNGTVALFSNETIPGTTVELELPLAIR